MCRNCQEGNYTFHVRESAQVCLGPSDVIEWLVWGSVQMSVCLPVFCECVDSSAPTMHSPQAADFKRMS